MPSDKKDDYLRPGNWLRDWRIQAHSDSELRCPVKGCRDSPKNPNPSTFKPDINVELLHQHFGTKGGPTTNKTVTNLDHEILNMIFDQRHCPHDDDDEFGSLAEAVIHENDKHRNDKKILTIQGFIEQSRRPQIDRGVWSDELWLWTARLCVGTRLAAILERYTWYDDFFTFYATDGSKITFPDKEIRRTNAYHRASSSTEKLNDNEMQRWQPFTTENFLAFMSGPDYAGLYTDQVKADVEKLKKKHANDEI